MSDDKDELIQAQKQVIGILFEIIKRLQSNNDLDEEYFQIVASNKTTSKKDTMKNSKIFQKQWIKVSIDEIYPLILDNPNDLNYKIYQDVTKDKENEIKEAENMPQEKPKWHHVQHRCYHKIVA